MNYTIEIATTDFSTTQAAINGGADRVELCSSISEGGLTPSYGLIKKCLENFTVPIFPIIRPRSGDFLYTEDEFEIILEDIARCKQLGCRGVVTGFLKMDGSIDLARTRAAVVAAGAMEITFHRAFDRCANLIQSLDLLVSAGCTRVLTSGGELNALDGALLIKQLVEIAQGRIIVVPGSGVVPANILQIAKVTGAIEFHAALRSSAMSKMEYRVPAFEKIRDYIQPSVEISSVQALKAALNTAKMF